MYAKSMKKNLVSIIIPNYNHENFLKKRIESVINQSYQNIEIIILDDCSTDNSLKIIKDYEIYEKVINITINKSNSGSPFKQWKKGLELSHGEYIWIAESDDFNDNYFIQTLIEHHKKYPTIGLAYSNTFIVDESDKIIDKHRYVAPEFDEKHWDKSFFSLGRDEVVNFLIYACTIPNVSCVLFKKKALIDNINFIQEFKSGGDYMIYARILNDYDLYFDNKFLNFFRMHSSTTRGFNEKKIKTQMLETIKVKEYIGDFFHINSMVISNIKQRHIERKDFFYDKTASRLEALLKKLKKIPQNNSFILAPYNYYTKIISSELLKSGYKITCFLDSKNFEMDVSYNQTPVHNLNYNKLKDFNNSIFIIASDRYKKEIHENMMELFGETVDPVFF